MSVLPRRQAGCLAGREKGSSGGCAANPSAGGCGVEDQVGRAGAARPVRTTPVTKEARVEVVVKGRHTEVPDRFRHHVEEKLSKVARLDHRVSRIDVELSEERNPRLADQMHRIEMTCRSRGPVIRAEAAA